MQNSNDHSHPKKAIRTFAAASFLNDMGSDMIYPIWPLFVTQIMGANMAVLGLIDGLGEAVVSISKALSGYLSDRIQKRKIFIWSGYLMGSLSRIGYALATTWGHLIPFRILDRAGKIRSAPRDAIIADLSTQKTRGKHFGLIRAADHLGAVVGILICVLLFNIIGYQKLFLLAAIPSIIGAVIIIRNISERGKPGDKIYQGLRLRDLNRDFILFLILSTIFSIGAFSYSFLLIYAREFGFKAGFIPVLYLVYTGIASLSAYPFGRLADLVGRKNVLLIAFIMWGLVSAAALWSLSEVTTIFMFILFGMHKGAIEPVQKAFVAELTPLRYRASSLGVYQMVIGLSAFPASLIAGLLWDNVGLSAPFILALILTGIAAVLLLFVKE